jgi:hypothetical protein
MRERCRMRWPGECAECPVSRTPMTDEAATTTQGVLDSSRQCPPTSALRDNPAVSAGQNLVPQLEHPAEEEASAPMAINSERR